MRVSVIIPSHGRPEFLRQAIDSVLCQTITDIECIVVDDASPVPVIVPNIHKVRLIRRERNGGAGAARNTGIDAASGEVICFLDDDDLYTPNRVALALEGLARAPVAVCFSRWLDRPAKAQRILAGNVHSVIAERGTPPLGTTAIRRDALIPFDERFRTVEDVDWWIRITQAQPVVTVPSVGYLVRRHSGVRVNSGMEQRVSDSRFLLRVHEEYFATNGRAKTFRWRRIGLMSKKAGKRREAAFAFLRASIGGDLRSLLHLIRV